MLVKGKSVILFVIGIPLLVIGTLLYAKSEQLSGWAHVHQSHNLEVSGGIVFLLGILCWVASYFTKK